MKKVILILDGVVAQHFLQVVLEKYFSNNLYIVILKDESLIPAKIPSAFSFYCFDPTSKFHIENTISESKSDISDAFIIMSDSDEKKAVYEILRHMLKDIRIITYASGFDEKYLKKQDERDIFIDSSSTIAGQFLSRLPNVPMIPQGFGLGKGEIMEISVPFGSVFAYRHIGSIQQKNYKIVGLYRKNEFILSTFSLVIQPRDIVLVAGEPKTLQTIYRQIKSDIGQFPSPFGRDIYVYVDMILQEKSTILSDIQDALFFHSIIRSTKLFVCVLHPCDFQTINAIKDMCERESSVNLSFEYHNLDFRQKLTIDSEKKIGLIIVGQEIFSSRKNRKALFKTSSPVLKTAQKSLKDVHKVFVALNEEMNEGENISPVIFDIAIQTKMAIEVYDFDPDSHHQNDIIKDYEALSRGLDKKITLIKTSIKNPVFYLNDSQEAILQFLPFEECITNSRFFSAFSTRTEKLSILLTKHPQMFIPIIE